MKQTGRYKAALHGAAAAVVVVLATALSVAAQDIKGPPPKPAMPKELPLQSILFDVEQLAKAQPNLAAALPQLKVSLDLQGINLDDAGKVLCEIIGPEGGAAISADVIAPFGGEITATWQRRAEALIPITALSGVARALPAGYVLERADVPGQDATGGEGATAINSDSYRDGGRDGSGRIVAVIDGGYFRFTTARDAGDAPPAGQTTLINYASGTFESGTNRHGTACVEAVFDHAPGANYRLYRIDSLTDMGIAVLDAIANGVDVISHSLSRYNTGWADNSGDACAAAINAASNGVLFFTSAGNRANQHWQGTFNAGPDGDQWHNWLGGDELNTMTFQPGGGGSFYLSWNTAGSAADYDLYIYEDNSILASSTNGGNTFESFSYTNNTASTKTLGVSIWRASGVAKEFELFFHETSGTSDFQYAVAVGSTTSPSNTTNANVLSVGAVPADVYGQANGSNPAADYSSRGPSNSGAILPKIAGPTNTGTTAYSGAFSGTSAATPNSAGAAAAFWSADSQLSSSAIRWLIETQADLWRDWGTAGDDNTYGRGGVFLTDYRNNTIWVARGYGNLLNSRSAPFYTTQAAYNAAVSGGRLLIIPGGSYPEALSTIGGTKSLSVQTLVNSANLGF